jgi:hypothetical protein
MTEEVFLVNPETGSRHRLGGCIPSNKPSDLPKFSLARIVPDNNLPPGVDLRQLMTPVEQQEQINAWLVFREHFVEIRQCRSEMTILNNVTGIREGVIPYVTEVCNLYAFIEHFSILVLATH